MPVCKIFKSFLNSILPKTLAEISLCLGQWCSSWGSNPGASIAGSKTLAEITSAVGASLNVDKATSEEVYGHFAGLLIDVNLKSRLLIEEVNNVDEMLSLI